MVQMIHFDTIGCHTHMRSGRSCSAAGPTRAPAGQVDGSVSGEPWGRRLDALASGGPAAHALTRMGLPLIPGVVAAHRDEGIPDVEGQLGLIHLDREAAEMTADSAREVLGAHPSHALRDGA